MDNQTKKMAEDTARIKQQLQHLEDNINDNDRNLQCLTDSVERHKEEIKQLIKGQGGKPLPPKH